MILDDFDIFCIVAYYQAVLDKRPTPTTYEIAREYFVRGQKIENMNRFLGDKANFVGQRLKKMEKDGIMILKTDKDGSKRFEPNVDKVFMEKHVFHRFKKMAIVVKHTSGKWMAFEI